MAQPQTNKKLANAASLAATYTSSALDIGGQSNIGLEVIWTGTPVGTFTVECSNSATKPDGTDGTWIALTFATALTAPSGAAGNMLIDLNQLPYKWVRIKFTRTSGTGTLTVTAQIKGLA